MTEAHPQYTPENTVVTVYEDVGDRKQKELQRVRRAYCAMPLETRKYAYGSLSVVANKPARTAEFENTEVLLGKKETLDEEIGGLLLKACVSDLKNAGYKTLIMEGAEEAELAICKRLNAEDALTFLDKDNTIAPLSLEQVIVGTEYMDQEMHTSREFASGSYMAEYFDVVIDLESVDTAGWQRAVDQEPYLASFDKR